MTREEIYSRFEELDKRASLGGGVDKIEKQHAQGKMTARERIGMLLDKGTFNELDKLVNTTVVPTSAWRRSRLPEMVWSPVTER